MLSFMSDRRVLAASAAFITAAILLFLVGTFPSWRGAVGHGVSSNDESPAVEPASHTEGQAALVKPEPVTSIPAAPASPVAPAPAATEPSPASVTRTAVEGPAAQDQEPTFDVVRVEPTGESVIAARAKAGAAIFLLDGGKAIAQAQADASGQVAFVPPTLAPGEHSLMLSVGQPNSPGALSSQSIAVSIPEQAKAAPMVALIQPNQPTAILSGTESPQAGPGASPSAAGSETPSVAVGAIDVEEMGSIFATGKATPNSHCRIYLNGSFIATVTSGKDGKWSLKIQRGMKPGRYVVRVDQVGSAAGRVEARAEVPFEYPARLGNTASLLRPKRTAQTDHSLDGGPAKTGRSAVTGPVVGGSMSSSGNATSSAGGGKDGAPLSTLATDARAVAPQTSEAAVSVSPTVDAMPTIVAQLLMTKVAHGDSLWRISRKILGQGQRYTQIYAVNTAQIRDPRLIYPGQIFVMPQNAP